jgi:hypothetical protein
MLGWHVSIYRQADGGGSPAKDRETDAARIAVWQTGWNGLEWLDELVRAGKAVDLGGNGYPSRYTAPAEHVIPIVLQKPPGAHEVWLCEPSDIILDSWEGKTVVDRAAAEQCRPGEWLLVEAWDES